MIRRLIFCLFVLCLLPSIGAANTGVFSGVGNQVMPIRNNDIQLVKEDVNSTLRIEDKDVTGLPLVPRADVRAEFLLRNTKDESVSVEMGFPFMDLQGFGNEGLVLSKLNFRAEDEEGQRPTTLKEGVIEPTLDPKGLFKKVLVWSEHFRPLQTKKLVITYQLLLTIGSDSTCSFAQSSIISPI